MSPDAPAMLELEAVRFGYPARPDFLTGVSMTVRAGECWAIVGPNGAGKSTLLRLMAGLRQPQAGHVRFFGQDLRAVPARLRSRRIAFMPQQPPSDLDLSAREIVLMGRFPHRSLGLFESAEDHRIAERALDLTKTTAFADRPIATLSGGEAQRVHLAAALAQAPELLLLDEPTASLDIQHQLAIFEILRGRTEAEGLTVVVVTHDVNLARRFCSHVLLLDNGRQVATGTPGKVITPEVLGPVYGVELVTLAEAVAYQDAPCGTGWVVPKGASGERRP